MIQNKKISNPLIPTINLSLKGPQLALSPYIAKIPLNYSRVKVRIIDPTIDIQTKYLCWKHRKGELIEFGTRGYETKLEDLGLLEAQVHLVRKKAESTRHEVVIAAVDHDGFGALDRLFGTILAPTLKSSSETHDR